MAGETKVEFDILANDKASSKLDKVARAFKNVGDEANDVDKNSGGIDRLSAKFKKAGDDSGKGFGSSLKKWFTGDGTSMFTNLGKLGSNLFGNGLVSGILKTPVLGPAMAGALLAAVAVAAPAAGAVAASGLVAGFGAGLAGLGIVFAAKSEAVKSAWSKTMAQLGADMRLLSKPFENTLINIAGYFQRTVDKFNPVLGKAFASMAPVVDKFVDGAARSLEQLIPAIGPITAAFGAVLKSLGPALQSAVGSLSKGMTELALSVERNPDGLADMVKGLGDFTGLALRLVTVLNDVNGSFSTLTGGTSLVDVVMEGLKATMMPLITLFAGFGKVLDLTNAALGKTGKDSEGAGAAMSKAANDTAQLAAAYQKTGTAAHGVAAPVKTMAEKVADAKKAAAEAKQRFEDFITTLFRVQNLALSLSGAQIGLQEAIDAASASVKENGRTLDINTAKGQANKRSLDAVAAAANVQSEQMIRSGKGTSAAGIAAEKSKASFIKLAMQMGATRPEAQKMAKDMLAIPNVSREARLTANKKDLDTKLAAAQRALKDPNLTKTRKAELKAEITALLRATGRAQTAINSLHGKTVNVFMNTIITERRNVITSRLPIDGRAVGGPVKKGTPYIVGEKGPELMVPDQSGTIVPNGATARGMVSGSGGGSVNLVFKSDGTPYMEFLIKEFRKYIRIEGGNVQAVLGR